MKTIFQKAGHSESGGELVTINGKQFKEFYGMSSATAMKKYVGKVFATRSFRCKFKNRFIVGCELQGL